MFAQNQTMDICYSNQYFNKTSTYCQNFSESSDSLSNQSSPTMPNNYYDVHAYTPNYMGDYEMSDEGTRNVNNEIRPPTVNRGGRKQVKVGTTKRNARERNRVRYINNCFEVLREHIPVEMASDDKNHKLSKVETLKYATIYIQQLTDLLTSTETSKIDIKSEPIMPSGAKKIKTNKTQITSKQENIKTISDAAEFNKDISYNNINVNIYENSISNSPSPVYSSASPCSTASSVSIDFKYYNQEFSPNNNVNPYFNCSKSSLFHTNSFNNYENVSNRQMHYGHW